MRKYYLYVFLSLILFIGCKEQAYHQDPVPVHDTFKIESKEVGEIRTINVWLPPAYAQDSVSYPVLYMPDGGIQEDFPHIANTLAELIEKKSIPPFILVGIENTQRRRDLSGPTQVEKDKEIAPVVGESKRFRNFINNELFTEINNKYRTTSEKGIIGESLAGLFIVETMMLKPDMFDYYIAIDPSLWWNDSNLVKTAKEHLDRLPTDKKRFWFAGSNAADMSQFTRKLSEVLETEKYPNLTWKYSDEPNEEHHTIYRATKEKALIWTLNFE